MATSLATRPMVDLFPDAPLKFYGVRVRRDGAVFAFTSPAVHGRGNPNRESHVGSVQKMGRVWVARTRRNFPIEAATQSEAAVALMRFVEMHQEEAGR